ncbi:biotin transporter BioY [Paenibacillus thalictri]|uniref:Biotin transporter n=1 Tax=Paenibacillus thalictri TaxID=2527873 RepID=A0A4Q9DKA9_9BACL|nr:biotin transporter BioY [Paenibacillus thalictri]TBL72469.1 biotin transporter BioY [Paenibacillus thalictri]
MTSYRLRGIVYSALFAALFIVLSFVKITLGFSPVPVTLEGFALMLAGGMLGARYGFYSIAAVVVLTLIGLPLLHGQGGIPLVFGATGGFIWMFPVMSFVIGFAAERIKGGKAFTFIAMFLVMEIASLLLYVTGVPWLAHVLHISMEKALASGCYPYLIPDAIKALAAAAIVTSLRKYAPSFKKETNASA